MLLALLPLLVAGVTLALLHCLWRMTTLLRHWRPAAARVVASDYPEWERRDDRRSGGFTAGTVRGVRWSDGEDSRLIRDDVIFEDRDGIRRWSNR